MPRLRLSMGQLRSLLSELAVKEDGTTYELSLKDFESCLIRKDEVITRKGVMIYVPYVHRPGWPTGELGNFARALGVGGADKKGNKIPTANSRTFLAALKRDEPIEGTNITLTASQDVRDQMTLRMAAAIAAKYEGRGIDVVIPAASGANVAGDMAKFIAQRIGAKFIDKVVAKKDRTEMVFDEERFKRLKGTPEEKRLIQAMLPSYQKQAGAATVKGMKPSLKRYFSFFKPGENKESLVGRTVLIVDDNVDEGVSLDNIRDLLIEAGVSPDEIYFASGFDYQGTKTERDFFRAA